MAKWKPIMALLLTLAFVGACGPGPLDVYQAATDERSLGTYANDALIKRKIQGKILSHDDEKIRKAVISLSVSVHRGRVVLVAELADMGVGEECINVARNTKDVVKVDAYFLPEDKGGTVDDTKIAAKVKGRFLKDSELKGFQVEVSVIQGHVVLAGFVENSIKKAKCLELANGVEGVVKVVDYIQVK